MLTGGFCMTVRVLLFVSGGEKMQEIYKTSVHRVSEIDAAVDGFQSHAANAAIHMTDGEKKKLQGLNNYDDSELRREFAALSAAVSDITAVTSIPANANLDSYVTVGRFYCPNSARAQTLGSCPWNSTGFSLEVLTLTGASVMQRITPATSSGGVFIMRVQTSSGWQSWYRFSGTEIPASAASEGNSHG